MGINSGTHLSRSEQIKLGSFYTPKKLVAQVYQFIQPYLDKNKKDAIIFDNTAGCGAFIMGMKEHNYRVADCDKVASEFLKKHLASEKIFSTNSLVDVARKKYEIPNDAFLIMVGNPPYNDITSEFKNGQKGQNISDDDLFDRDLGVSFLKSYEKLKANVVCVLHPLSYLIKETNFNRLKKFRANYKLIKATVFSSSWFSKTGSIKFPIMIGLYERDNSGMNFNDIRNFTFSILGSNKTFNLSGFETTDGYINKYPPRKNDATISPIGLYYYTFRDFNSLQKNTSFMNKPHYNAIVVTAHNFYKYAYLSALKKLFQPDNLWLYGNLSPLVNRDLLEKHKSIYVEYALQTNSILKNTDREILKEITNHYGIDLNNLTEIEKLEVQIRTHFKTLIPSGYSFNDTKKPVNYLQKNNNEHNKQLTMAMERRTKYKTMQKKSKRFALVKEKQQ